MVLRSTRAIVLCAVAVASLLLGCSGRSFISPHPPLAADQAVPWTGLAANDAAADFHFVIVGDRTRGARPGVFEAAISKANLLEPAFVVSIGDLIDGHSEDQAGLDREWDEFEGFVARLETPFFYAAGNHDMSNAVMAETWQARFGPSYYSFTYKDVLFLVLNSELFDMARDMRTPVPGPWTQAEQMAFIAETLQRFPDPRWTIVLIHQSLWDQAFWKYADAPQDDWRKVEAMLGQRDYTVFAGHSHRYVKIVRQDRRYITLATTGGGSGLRGLMHGEFDQVALVSMTDAGPRIANLTLEGIQEENVTTAASLYAVRNLDRAVYSVPAFGSGTHFEAGIVAFDVANHSDKDMTVAFHVDPGPHLVYAAQPQPFTVAPGQTERVEIALAASQTLGPLPYHTIAPGRAVWSLATEVGSEPFRFEKTTALLPVAPLPMPSGPAPSVDGDLADWPALPYTVHRQGDVATAHTAQTDISFSFGVREAEGDIYFAAQVTDDHIVASSALGPRKQDGLLLLVDAHNEPPRSAKTRWPTAGMAVDRLTLADAIPDWRFPAESRAAVTWKTKRTAAGYVAEAKISGAFLDVQAGGAWQTLRIGVTAVDWDEHERYGYSGTALHWQPDRFGEAPVAGSGTFERENAELRAVEGKHELTTEPPEMSSGGSNRSDWFWQQMAPHFDHRSNGIGLIVDGRTVQAFVRDCAPDELAVWSWVGLGEETAVDSWTRTQTGLCLNARTLPHNALPSVSVATMSVSDWVSGPLARGRPPIIRSDWDVYLVEDSLIYAKDQCGPEDTEPLFFVHLDPVDRNDLPSHRQQHGFDGFNFAIRNHLLIKEGACVARRELPDYTYAIAAIRTGQFIGDGKNIWEGTYTRRMGEKPHRE